jgi:hypothetical protein
VSSGRTRHAELFQIAFAPARIAYGQLLRVFFPVVHDPTEWNRQGPDEGTQYRSVIFYANDEQKRVAEAYIAQLNQAKVFRKAIVTQAVASTGFYPAEAIIRTSCGVIRTVLILWSTIFPSSASDSIKIASASTTFADWNDSVTLSSSDCDAKPLT